MFESARIKLTLWYVVIIMAVSIAFSIFIYVGTSREFDRIVRIQRFHIEHPGFPYPLPPQLILRVPPPEELQVVQEARERELAGLIGVNGLILFLSALAGYFLAGITLKPIQKMVEEQDRFITDASHELRTPLTALRTELEVGLRKNSLTLSDAKQLLSSNLEEVIGLQNLSDSLLTFSQPNSGKTVAVSIPDTVEKALKVVGPLAKSKQIIIKKKMKEVSITAVPEKIEQLFIILLDNAIKYSNKKSTITIVVDIKEDVIITIKDTGVGIAKEDLSHIFERFYQANKSRSKNVAKGYGLGLSIAHQIVEENNGSIIIESDAKGTTVTMRFALKKA